MNPEVKNFLKNLKNSIQEYKKEYTETSSDEDAARFFDKNLKKWISQNMDAINVLASLGLNKSFVTFVKHYLFEEYED